MSRATLSRSSPCYHASFLPISALYVLTQNECVTSPNSYMVLFRPARPSILYSINCTAPHRSCHLSSQIARCSANDGKTCVALTDCTEQERYITSHAPLTPFFSSLSPSTSVRMSHHMHLHARLQPLCLSSQHVP